MTLFPIYLKIATLLFSQTSSKVVFNWYAYNFGSHYPTKMLIGAPGVLQELKVAPKQHLHTPANCRSVQNHMQDNNRLFELHCICTLYYQLLPMLPLFTITYIWKRGMVSTRKGIQLRHYLLTAPLCTRGRLNMVYLFLEFYVTIMCLYYIITCLKWLYFFIYIYILYHYVLKVAIFVYLLHYSAPGLF